MSDRPLDQSLQALVGRLATYPRVPPSPSEEIVCDVCKDGGRLTWEDRELNGPCPYCEKGMGAMGVPERFRRADLHRDFGQFTAVQGWAGEPPGWYLYGPVGVGKSHLAAAFCREAARGLKHARFISTAQYLEQLRQGMDDDVIAAKARWEIDELAKCDVVVLDDLGSENLSTWAQEQLLLLVNKLYNRDVALIVTSNYDHGELSEHLDERITSRIAGLTEVLPMRGLDRRQKGRRPKVVQG